MLLGAVVLSLFACRPATPAPAPPTTVAPAPATVASKPTPGATATDVHPVASPDTPASSTPARTPTLPPTAVPGGAALRPAFRSLAGRFPDATRYHLDLTLQLGEATLLGRQRVSYTNTEDVPLEALYLRLFPNTSGYGGQMSVVHLSLNGERLEPVQELEGSALRVPLDPPLDPGSLAILSLDFVLALPTDGGKGDRQTPSAGYRQLGIYDGVVALANAYALIPVYDSEGWNVEVAPSYGDAVFSDAAFFSASITSPPTMTLAASGTCRRAEVRAAETKWSCAAPLMRDFNAVLGDDYRTESRDVNGVTVNSIFYSRHDGGGRRALDYASRAVRLFGVRVGPYPFAELDVVESPTLAGGIEYPGLVVVNQSYYDSMGEVGARLEWVVVHEVLHQWWYGLVGSDQVDEPWLDEALVQYCTVLYYEEEHGQETADELIESVFRQPYQELLQTGRDQPAGLPVVAYEPQSYGPVVYRKGPLYFHELRQEVGPEEFWEILRVYFERNRYGIARPQDWLNAVESVTGSEHRSLYEAWIGDTEG